MNRFEKLFEKLPETAECAVITSDINRRYFTGMKSSDGIVIVFRDKAYLLIDFRYIEKARLTVENAEVVERKRTYPQLKELLDKHGVHSFMIESGTMTVSELNRMKRNLDAFEINSSDTLSNAIASLRKVKDISELVCIKKAQEIAETAYSELLGFIKAGVTEREIALELNRLMFMHGAEDISFETIALSGANTSMPHGVPSDKKVEEGEFILLDFGAVYNGYHSDMTRTFCLGEPDDEMKRVYDIVLRAQEAALAAAKAGMSGRELDAYARDIISEAGYGECFGHSLGHGVGLEIHESPTASPNSEEKLQSGEVVTVEPGIYIAGKFGVRIEDFVVLTDNGNNNLTKCEKNMVII